MANRYLNFYFGTWFQSFSQIFQYNLSRHHCLLYLISNCIKLWSWVGFYCWGEDVELSLLLVMVLALEMRGGALQPLSEGTSHYGRLVELTPGVHHDDGLPLVLLPVPQGVGDLESFSGKSQDWPTVVLDDLHAEVLHLHHLALVVLPPVFS